MSDYVSELRRDLVEAAEREQHRGRAGRVARPLPPARVVADRRWPAPRLSLSRSSPWW